jgi:hypothetical protein
VRHGVVDAQVLKGGLLPGHDHVHVVTGPQAVIGDGQQAVGVGRQVHPYGVGLLVHHVIDETRILV